MATETMERNMLPAKSIKAVFKDGYSWVEIPDEQWARAIFTLYIKGMPIG